MAASITFLLVVSVQRHSNSCMKQYAVTVTKMAACIQGDFTTMN